jgi:hypothetical protein
MLRWIFIAVLLAGCGRTSPPEKESTSSIDPQPALEAAPIKDLEGGWVLNRDWEGYMGVAIRFHANGVFDYWFNSDIADASAPTYPVTGKWKWDGDVLQLESEHHLHDTRWHVYQHQGENCLLPDYAWKWNKADGKDHQDRLLFRIANFEPARPFDERR